MFVPAFLSGNAVFLFQNNIVKILGEEKVEQVELIKTELVQKEGETRKVPVNIPNSNYIIDIDYIVMIAATILTLLFGFKGKIGRLGGAFMFICFILYNLYLIH